MKLVNLMISLKPDFMKGEYVIKTIKTIVIKLINFIKQILTNNKTIPNDKNEIRQIMNGGNNNTQIGIQNNN